MALTTSNKASAPSEVSAMASIPARNAGEVPGATANHGSTQYPVISAPIMPSSRFSQTASCTGVRNRRLASQPTTPPELSHTNPSINIVFTMKNCTWPHLGNQRATLAGSAT